MIARNNISFFFSFLLMMFAVNILFSNELSSSFSSRDIPIEWDEDGDGFFDDISIYQNSGSITSRIYSNEVDITSDGDDLASFVDG